MLISSAVFRALLAAFLIPWMAHAEDGCPGITKLKLSHARINSAELISAGALTSIGQTSFGALPSFCRVALTLTPSKDSEIRVEVWLPESGWNGRFQGTGNGGYAGNMGWGSLATGVRQGYAVANTDMGMQVPAGSDAGIFVGRPERWADWGYRATHEMTSVGKRIVEAYYGRRPHHSYFVGCSTGGQQGLMEAQRYPDDYDGIVAGAPAHNRTGVHTSILWTFAATQRTPGAAISPPKAQLLANAAIDKCDEQDGLKDGLISDPQRCAFRPEALLCKAGNTMDCLTPEQVETAQRIYSGVVDPRTGKKIYGGLPPGSETQWPRLQGPLGATQVPPFNPIFKWVFGGKWNWRAFDFHSDFARMNSVLSRKLNATDPDLNRFRMLGHKLILWHGMADWLVPPDETVDYYRAVQEYVKHRNASDDAGQFARLYMLPGVYHCSSGPGPNRMEHLEAVVNWVENGVGPGVLTATKFTDDNPSKPVLMERPVCPWPDRATYKGTGDPRRAENFTCISADQKR